MNLSKTVVSRKGNTYYIDFSLSCGEMDYISVKDSSGKEIFVGSGRTHRKSNDDNYIVKTIQDIILLVEEKYSNYDSLKSFEEWDGVIL